MSPNGRRCRLRRGFLRVRCACGVTEASQTREGERGDKKFSLLHPPLGPRGSQKIIDNFGAVHVGNCSEACEHGSPGGPIRDKNDTASWTYQLGSQGPTVSLRGQRGTPVSGRRCAFVFFLNAHDSESIRDATEYAFDKTRSMTYRASGMESPQGSEHLGGSQCFQCQQPQGLQDLCRHGAPPASRPHVSRAPPMGPPQGSREPSRHGSPPAPPPQETFGPSTKVEFMTATDAIHGEQWSEKVPNSRSQIKGPENGPDF